MPLTTQDENERQPFLAALATRRNFPPPSHVLQRPDALSRGPSLTPHERMQARRDSHGQNQSAHPSPPKTATFAPTTSAHTSPAKSDSSTPKRAIRSAPSSPLVPNRSGGGGQSRASPRKGKDRAVMAGSPKKDGEGIYNALRIRYVQSSPGPKQPPMISFNTKAEQSSPTSLARPAFKLPPVPENNRPAVRRRLLLDGPSTVPSSPSPGLTGPIHSRPTIAERSTAPPTALLHQSATVGPSRRSTFTQVDRQLKSIFHSLSDLRRKLASPPVDSQGGSTSGSFPVKPSTPVLHGPFGARILVPPLSPPLFGRSVSEPQHLHRHGHRRLSSGNIAQLFQTALHAHHTSDPPSASTSREDMRPPEIEGFATHQLSQGIAQGRQKVLATRGRPRSSTAAASGGSGWLGPSGEVSRSGAAIVTAGEARDRERSDTLSRPRPDRSVSSRGGGGTRGGRTASRPGSRNASALSLGIARTISDEAESHLRNAVAGVHGADQSKSRQRDGSVGRGYPGVAGQGRRGRSPGPSRLGSRNPSSESLWPFEGDSSRSQSRSHSRSQLHLPANSFNDRQAQGHLLGLGLTQPIGALSHRPSLSAIAQSGLSHGTPDTARIDRHQRERLAQQQQQRRHGGKSSGRRKHKYRQDRHYHEDTPDQGMSEADDEQVKGRSAGEMRWAGRGEMEQGKEDPESPGLQMTARAKKGTRSIGSTRSGVSRVSGASTQQE